MRQLLKLHPDTRSFAAQGVEVEIARSRAGGLALSYVVTGIMNEVRIPPMKAAQRVDGLWQHTCFEAFIRAPSGAKYYEFNFAPSKQWAAYRFGGYRSEMCVADEISAPTIEVRSSPDSFTLEASLELDNLLVLPRETSWRVGLSAIVEEMNGRKSYWALAHPPGKPDFHHADGFAFELAPAAVP